MAVPTILMAVTMEGAGIGGDLAVEVSLVVVPRATVARTARAGPEMDVKTTMTDDDPVEEGQGTPTIQMMEAMETEGISPLMTVTTVDEGLVDAPNWPTSWIGW